MRCSKLVGTIKKPEVLTVSQEVNGEKFYEVDVIVDGVSYPAVISEHLLSQEGKHQIEYYLRSKSKDKRLFTFINIVVANKVDEETEDLNSAEVYGYVAKEFPMKVKKKGEECVKMLGVRYFSSDRNINLAHCIGFKDIARRMNKIQKEDNVLFVGHLKMDKSIEVVVKDITIHHPARQKDSSVK